MNRTYSLQPTGPRGWCKYRRGGICIWTAIASENIWRGAQYIHEMTGDHPRGPVRLYKRRWWWSLIFICVFFKKNKKKSSLSPFQLSKEKERKKKDHSFMRSFSSLLLRVLNGMNIFNSPKRTDAHQKCVARYFISKHFFFWEVEIIKKGAVLRSPISFLYK
jgi:hypothetical protein